MNFLEISQRVREEAGISGTGPSTVVGQQGQLKKIVEWVRAAWTEIQNKRPDWLFLWNDLTYDTTAGVDQYDLSTNNIRRIDKVSAYNLITGVVDETFLTEISYAEMRTLYKHGVEATGKPQYFAIRPDKTMIIAPIPDAVYRVQIEYYRTPQRLVNNADIPLLPEHYHELIVYRALMKFGTHYEATMTYQDADAHYRIIMNDVEDDQLPELKVAPPLA